MKNRSRPKDGGNQEKRLPVREAVRLNWRAMKLWYSRHSKLFGSIVCSALVTALTPYVGIYLSARIIDELTGARNPEQLFWLVTAALLSEAALYLLTAAAKRWKNSALSGIYLQNRQIYTDKLLSMDFCDVEDAHTQDLYSQILQNDQWSGWGSRQVIRNFEALAESVTRIAGAVVLSATLFTRRVPADAGWIAVFNHPVFGVLLAAILLGITLLSPVLANRGDVYWVKYSERAKLGNRYFGFFGFSGLGFSRGLDFRIYRQDILYKKGMEEDDNFTPTSQIARWARGPIGLYHALSGAISRIFTGIVYAFVCLKAWGGAFGVGSVTQYIGAITSLSEGISALVGTLGTMRSNASFLQTTFAFLDIPNKMYQGSLTVEKRRDRNYEVEFRNVSFCYPGSREYALKNLSIKFKVGQRLAVVGRNGSGKTTFIKLLCRLYDPTEGEILLNGIDIRKYNYGEYLSIFSVVFQDFQLLAFPLGQNVAVREQYDRERVQLCLEKAGFGQRLSQMPEGLEGCLYKEFDDKGVEISGGEAQKIAIARALYKDAPFIILDEPTAALDPVAEYEIYTKFNEIVGDKTAIYISHRLSSCRFCDEILVFEGGKIVQQGGHEVLLSAEDGKYRELWQAQEQYYRKDAN